MLDPLLERISVDPAVCGGRPCVRGHRVWVSVILGLLAEGVPERGVLAEYPGFGGRRRVRLHRLRSPAGQRSLPRRLVRGGGGQSPVTSTPNPAITGWSFS